MVKLCFFCEKVFSEQVCGPLDILTVYLFLSRTAAPSCITDCSLRQSVCMCVFISVRRPPQTPAPTLCTHTQPHTNPAFNFPSDINIRSWMSTHTHTHTHILRFHCLSWLCWWTRAADRCDKKQSESKTVKTKRRDLIEDRTDYFLPNVNILNPTSDLFLNLMKKFWCLNLTKPDPHVCSFPFLLFFTCMRQTETSSKFNPKFVQLMLIVRYVIYVFDSNQCIAKTRGRVDLSAILTSV